MYSLGASPRLSRVERAKVEVLRMYRRSNVRARLRAERRLVDQGYGSILSRRLFRVQLADAVIPATVLLVIG